MAVDGQSLRIAHVTTERGFGGGEVQVLLLMDGLGAAGVAQTLVAPPSARIAAIARERGHAVAPIGLSHPFDLPSVWRLRRLLREFDLVHLHTGRASWLGGLAAAWAGVPRVVTRRTMRRVRTGPRARFVYGRSVAVIAVSAAIAEVLQRGGVAGDRIHVVPDAVDEARMRERAGRRATRAALGLGDGEFAVLAAGKLSVGKGQDLLLRAAAQLPGVRVVLAGEGPERAALQGLAMGLGIAERVQFLGARDDVGDLLLACDALAMPSRHEGLGNAAMEAMHLRRPVVAAKVGGLAELVRDGECGLCFAAEDVQGLAAALQRLIADPGLAARLAANGPARLDAGGLRAPQVTAAHLRIYRELLNSPPATARRTSPP